MALRRASLSVLKALQVQKAGVGVRPVAACMQFSTAAPATELRRSGHDAFDRNPYQRNFTQQLHSENQAKNDDHETFHYESSKMTAEGGGAEEKSFQEKSSEVLQDKAKKITGSDDVKEKTEEVTDTVKDKASEGAEEAKDTVKEVSEKATGVKEAGVEAGKSVVGDTGKAAEKVGISPETTENVSSTVTELKEVGQEAGKAVVRDAKKVAEKVGLK